MPDIQVRPDQLEADAETLRTHATRIQTAIDAVDAEIQRMNVDVFSGHMADSLRARYAQMREQMMSFAPMLKQFSLKLDEAAASFRQADSVQ